MRLIKAAELKHWWQAAAIAAICAAILYASSHNTAFTDFDDWTYDFTVIHAGLQPPSKDILLVDFDEETFARIRKYPIPRQVVAEVITHIAAQKPRVMGMDILLSETREPAQDQAMRDALTAAGNVVLASQTGEGSLPSTNPLPFFCQADQPGLPSGYCKENTPGAYGYGSINLFDEADGFVRQGFLIKVGPPASESFPLMMAEIFTGQTIKPVDSRRASFLDHIVWYADPAKMTILPGSWGRQPVTTVPAWKVLQGEIPAGLFTDKLILIGQSSDAARDLHFTPLFRTATADGTRQKLGGTQILGCIIRSLLEGTVVRRTPLHWEWAIVFFFGWIAAFVLLRLRTTIGLPVIVGLFLLPVVTSLYLYARHRFWLPFLPLELELALTIPFSLGLQFFEEQVLSREAHALREQLMTLFSSYVDPAVANTIWERRNEVSLNGEDRTATVLFTDIRSFTQLSAGKPPAEVLLWLNQYMTAMDEVIRLHGGFLNKFIGDGLMIIFGLPLSQGVREDAQRALHASLAMLERVQQLNRENAGNPTHPKLRIGIGIHTGHLMAGSIGSSARQEYSVIGETVNLASRLESLNKDYKTEILMSKATYDILVHDFTGFQPLGESMVKGFDEPIPVFTIASPATP